MIPKIMNFYWGNKTLSWMRYLTFYSFRKLNPDWKMVLHLAKSKDTRDKIWKDSPVQDSHNFEGEDFFKQIYNLNMEIREVSLPEFEDTEPSYKGDFFKWRLLWKSAGFYSDVDILYTSPFSSFYDKAKDSDVVICHNGKYFSIGLIGSSGSNRFYQDIYQVATENYTPNYYQSAGVMSVAKLTRRINPNYTQGLRGALKLFKRSYPEIEFFNFPMNWIYPWDSTKVKEIFMYNHPSLPEGCVGIHWYAGARLSQKFNNILTEKNVKDYQNTFSTFALKI